MGVAQSNGWFCRWGSIFANGRFLDLEDSRGFFDFIFVFQELRIKSKISLGTVASSLLI